MERGREVSEKFLSVRPWPGAPSDDLLWTSDDCMLGRNLAECRWVQNNLPGCQRGESDNC